MQYQSDKLEELESAFKDSINDYLIWCQERGEQPQTSIKKRRLTSIQIDTNDLNFDREEANER